MAGLLSLPTIPLFALVVCTMVAIAVTAQLLIKRAYGTYDFSQNNVLVGTVINIVGIVYAVVLGFVLVITWQGHVLADRTVFEEVNAVGDLYRYAPMLGAPTSEKLRADLRRYVDLEIGDEWPALKRGEHSTLAAQTADRLVADLVTHFTTDPAAKASGSFELNLLQKMLDTRRASLYSNGGVVPRLMWITLVLGSAVTIAMTFLVGSAHFRVHLLLTAGATAMIAFMLVVILELDTPYRGEASISEHYWQELRASFTR